MVETNTLNEHPHSAERALLHVHVIHKGLPTCFGSAVTPSVAIKSRHPSGVGSVRLMGPNSHTSNREGCVDVKNSKLIESPAVLRFEHCDDTATQSQLLTQRSKSLKNPNQTPVTKFKKKKKLHFAACSSSQFLDIQEQRVHGSAGRRGERLGEPGVEGLSWHGTLTPCCQYNLLKGGRRHVGLDSSTRQHWQNQSTQPQATSGKG